MKRLAELLSRPSSGRLIAPVEGLRFVAILSVVLFHLHGQAGGGGGLLSLGRHGVELFFVISGMVIALPYAAHALAGGERVRLRDYFLRRLTRIEPPYLINVAACFVLLLLTKPVGAGELLPHLGASVLYQHNLLYGQPSAINAVAWSLEIEVQFYLLAPLILNLLRLRNRHLRRGVLVGAALACVLLQRANPSDLLTLSLAGQLQYFLAGILLADLYVTGWNSAARSQTWDLVAFVGWPALVVALGRPEIADLATPLLFLLVAAAALRGRIASRVFGWRPVVVVGGMCYTIYLWHNKLISFAGPSLLQWSGVTGYGARLALLCAVLLPLVLAASCFLFLLTERPFMARRGRGGASA